jgi:hypothetical protein
MPVLDEAGDIMYIYETEDSTTFLPATKECPKTKECIIDNVSPSVLLNLKPFKDAHEMWYYLFTGENHSRKLQGIKAIASTITVVAPLLTSSITIWKS